jgi:hypothetical protein
MKFLPLAIVILIGTLVTDISSAPPHPKYLEFVKRFDKDGDGKLDEKERLEIRKLFAKKPVHGSFALHKPKEVKKVEPACACKDCKCCDKPKRKRENRKPRNKS